MLRGMIEGRAARTVGEEVERRVRARATGRQEDDPMIGLGEPGSELMNENIWTEEIRDVVDAYMVRS